MRAHWALTDRFLKFYALFELYQIRERTHLAYWLKFFIFFIVTRQQISAIFACSFTATMVTTYNNKIQSVSDSFQVIFLELKKKSRFKLFFIHFTSKARLTTWLESSDSDLHSKCIPSYFIFKANSHDNLCC